MAISFVGSHVGTHAAISAQSVAFSNLRNESNQQPTLQADDIVLVAVNCASTVDRTEAQLLPSGYTAAHTDLYQNDSNDTNLLVSYKVMGASPDSSVSIPASNATTAGVAYAIYVFRGVDTSTPLDVTPVTAGAINTGIANAGAISPSSDGAWIVAVAAAAVAAGAAFTNPSGMSATTNHFRSATITTTTNDANIGVALKTDWASGSFDPAAFGGSTSTNTGSWAAVTIALRPFVEAATGTMAANESGSDSFAGAGTVSDPAIAGSLVATESGTDTASVSGSVTVSGSAGATEGGADTSSASGSVRVSGSASASESGGDTASIGGGVAVGGGLGATESGTDTASGNGLAPVSGALSVSETGSDNLSGGGQIALSGTLAATEAGSDAFSGDGSQQSGISGSLDAAEAGNDAVEFIGGALVSAALDVAEDGDDAAAFALQVIVEGMLDGDDLGPDLMAALNYTPRRSSADAMAARPSQAKYTRPTQTAQARPIRISRGAR